MPTSLSASASRSRLVIQNQARMRCLKFVVLLLYSSVLRAPRKKLVVQERCMLCVCGLEIDCDFLFDAKLQIEMVFPGRRSNLWFAATARWSPVPLLPLLTMVLSCLHSSICSTSQALADYACLITALKQGLGAEGSPVVAFGGSYGGMLGECVFSSFVFQKVYTVCKYIVRPFL